MSSLYSPCSMGAIIQALNISKINEISYSVKKDDIAGHAERGDKHYDNPIQAIRRSFDSPEEGRFLSSFKSLLLLL